MKALLNRKLLLMVLGPILRALLSALTGYLTAKGLPADMVGEVTNAASAFAILAFNVGWELVERRKVAEKSAYNAVKAAFVSHPVDIYRTSPLYDEVRARFDREGG